MENLLNLEKYPLDQSGSAAYESLLDQCKRDLSETGMFNLEGFVKKSCLEEAIELLEPAMKSDAYLHSRSHNIYFQDHVEGLPDNHPALKKFQTTNKTLCADQLVFNPMVEIYEWQPLIVFLSKVMGKSCLYTMKDPLARVNVMSYQEGETLNWHFDRSEFTTTILMQSPEAGGEFEYRTGLRTASDPNYDGVARLLNGEDPKQRSINPTPGTLNVFMGINTPHRVTKIRGERERIIAVYSYYEKPDVSFSKDEQIGFYGRAA